MNSHKIRPMQAQNKDKLTFKFKLSVVLVIVLLILTADQCSKAWAVATLAGHASISYFGGLFQFVYAENPGAFLGMGGELSRELRFVIFAVLVVLGLGGMLWYLLKKETSKLNLVAYSLILAGGFGNLWDRVAHIKGHVIDFMLIEISGPFRTGVFNVADMAIVAGVLLALYTEYYFNRRNEKDAK